MTKLVEVVVDGDVSVLVEIDPSNIPKRDGLTLASAEPGAAIAKLSTSLAEALSRLEPVLTTLKEKLKTASPDHFTVEFGVTIGGETGIILAKGTAEVTFKITMDWARGQQSK